jgi:hypothetical protein
MDSSFTKARKGNTGEDVMLAIFFDVMGIIHKELVLAGILVKSVIFMATVCKCAKPLPQILATKELAVAS